LIALPSPEPVVDGLSLPECPRWRLGALYFSDITGGRAYRLTSDDRPQIVYQTQDDFVAGLGFLHDDSLLAVLSKGRRIVRIGPNGPADHAVLNSLCRFVLNDMVTTQDRAYVSQPGRDVWASELKGMPEPTDILMVSEDGQATIAASEMMGPNGMAVSPDGRTLYVAESSALRITCFTIDQATGALSDRRLFAQLPGGAVPDGVCLDDGGAVWAASPVRFTDGAIRAGQGVLRIIEGGEVTHVVPMRPGRRALACTFGGAGRSTLYVCTVPDFEGSSASTAGQGCLERVTIDFAGAGAP
jgi:sugar lactone lactonase YvrE